MRVTSSGQQAINLVFDFLLEDSNRKHAILQAPSFFGAIRSAKEWKSKGIHCHQFEHVTQVEEIVKSNPKGTVIYLQYFLPQIFAEIPDSFENLILTVTQARAWSI